MTHEHDKLWIESVPRYDTKLLSEKGGEHEHGVDVEIFEYVTIESVKIHAAAVFEIWAFKARNEDKPRNFWYSSTMQTKPQLQPIHSKEIHHTDWSISTTSVA